MPASPVVIYDADHYVMGGVLAEKLARTGLEVHLITPASKVSEWTDMTMEQSRVQGRLLEMGVQLHTATELAHVSIAGSCLSLQLNSIYTTAKSSVLSCASLVP